MRSKTFQTGGREKLIDDLKLLATLPLSSFESLINHVDKKVRIGYFPSRSELLQIAGSGTFDTEQLIRILNVVLYLYRQEREQKDQIGDVIEDFTSQKVVDDSEAKSVLRKMELARPVIQQRLQFELDRYFDISGSFPLLQYFHCRCATVTHFEPSVDLETADPASYSPGVPISTPVVVIQMDIGRFGSTDRISMALTLNELDELTKALSIARKELLAIENLYSRGELKK